MPRQRPGAQPARWRPRSWGCSGRPGAPLSPGQVRQRLAAGELSYSALSYSTVVTILSRLHAKGLLSRQRDGRAFTYTVVDEASLAASRMNQALQVGRDHDAVLTRFVSSLSGRDARLLRQLLGADSAGRPDPGLDPDRDTS